MTEYRIDDLARAAGTTTRNVRGYQDRGLIPRPIRRGRIAIYGDEHLAKLRVINDLLARGFTMTHIGDFFKRVQTGDDIAESLGLREVVSRPWSQTPTDTVTAAELHAKLNTSDPKLLSRVREFGLIEPIGDDDPPRQYMIKDVETIDAYQRLMQIGIPLPYILDLQRQLDEDMDRAAKTLISAGRRAITEGRFDGWIPESGAESDWASTFLGELKVTGRVAAHNTLYRALDRELARQLDDYLAVARERRDQRES
ncbi:MULTISPECIES: MerR family transcriptional regulator [Gordonia]|nr:MULTISPECIES: MerR family transcriptional regulator [Gordonia]AUH67184.1 MerR family transcriptional regulator [Gordonia sp. YC-JH1]KJR04917.1 MerR family transcriptional regulator [Gordonia sihwensis]KXT58435.1 MerR family transcriptional regulator [Gordonia sp. QH-12]MBY4569045.1 MerR family transcriptional regulator [Gordonia sihwensis]WFN93167.1 MerR family transcriptional regulator [Gordonia sihwensis]